MHKLLFLVGLDTGSCPPICTLNVPLKKLIPVNTSMKSLCIFFVNILLASLSAFPVCARPEIIWHICTIIGDVHTAGVDCLCSVLWGARYLPSLQLKFSAYFSQLSLQGSADYLEMIGFAAFVAFLSACRTLPGCISFPTILAFVTVCDLTFAFLDIFAAWH